MGYLKSCLILSAVLGLSSASSVVSQRDLEEFDAENDANAKTIFSSNGNLFVALNTTNLIFYGALLGIALLGLFAVATVFTAPAAANNNYSYQQKYSNQNYQYRQKRAFEDEMTSHMYQLAEAFKKYEVEEACQMYLSCEASQVEKKTHATPIPAIVREIMRAMDKNGHAKDPYVGQLLEAYRAGVSTNQCNRYRNRCYKKF